MSSFSHGKPEAWRLQWFAKDPTATKWWKQNVTHTGLPGTPLLWIALSNLCLNPKPLDTQDEAIWKFMIMCLSDLKRPKALACIIEPETQWQSYCGSLGYAHVLCVGCHLRLEQAAFYPVAEGCQPRSGEKHNSPEDLMPGSFPTYIFFFWSKFRATISAHSSQKVGSLINDFLCLDEKWFFSKR